MDVYVYYMECNGTTQRSYDQKLNARERGGGCGDEDAGLEASTGSGVESAVPARLATSSKAGIHVKKSPPPSGRMADARSQGHLSVFIGIAMRANDQSSIGLCCRHTPLASAWRRPECTVR